MVRTTQDSVASARAADSGSTRGNASDVVAAGSVTSAAKTNVGAAEGVRDGAADGAEVVGAREGVRDGEDEVGDRDGWDVVGDRDGRDVVGDADGARVVGVSVDGYGVGWTVAFVVEFVLERWDGSTTRKWTGSAMMSATAP